MNTRKNLKNVTEDQIDRATSNNIQTNREPDREVWCRKNLAWNKHVYYYSAKENMLLGWLQSDIN